MLKNITSLFSKKKEAIKNEIALKSKIDEVLTKFVKEEVFKNADFDYCFGCTVNKGIIKIETDNKLIAQEIALRIRTIEERLRREEINFRKLIV